MKNLYAGETENLIYRRDYIPILQIFFKQMQITNFMDLYSQNQNFSNDTHFFESSTEKSGRYH